MSKRKKYGITIDIGTTNIIIHLVRCSDNALVNQLLLKNPQVEYGADVISRIRSARKNKDAQRKLVLQIRNSIRKGIAGILEETRIKPITVSDVVIVGNTVMHHFFFDLPTDSLTVAPYTAVEKDSILKSASEVDLDILPNADVYSPPVIESFIGPDAIAVLFASGYLREQTRSMTIDVGTNTEVSVITPEGIWIASAASGPAFEGMAIECGMSGEIGAIESVRINPETYEPSLSIIDNNQSRGICGTGVISLIAALLESGLLLPRGSFNHAIQSQWTSFDSVPAYYIVAPQTSSSTGKEIILTQPDLRMLQQSKAAVRAATDLVLRKSVSNSDEINNLFLTGIFGSGLLVDDAYRIGMLPRFTNASVTQSRNGAIQGADMLLSAENRETAERISQQINYIELMDNEEFNQLFVESLPFSSK